LQASRPQNNRQLKTAPVGRPRAEHNRQQPCGITPGVAAAPVAFAGAIMAGLARFIDTLSLQAAEFGVGMTVIAGSMPVLPRSAADG
jgi:hypothetical protein